MPRKTAKRPASEAATSESAPPTDGTIQVRASQNAQWVEAQQELRNAGIAVADDDARIMKKPRTDARGSLNERLLQARQEGSAEQPPIAGFSRTQDLTGTEDVMHGPDTAEIKGALKKISEVVAVLTADSTEMKDEIRRLRAERLDAHGHFLGLKCGQVVLSKAIEATYDNTTEVTAALNENGYINHALLNTQEDTQLIHAALNDSGKINHALDKIKKMLTCLTGKIELNGKIEYVGRMANDSPLE